MQYMCICLLYLIDKKRRTSTVRRWWTIITPTICIIRNKQNKWFYK